MRPADLVIEPLTDLAQLTALEADCNADGQAMVSRLIREWRDGRNRFSEPGERIVRVSLPQLAFRHTQVASKSKMIPSRVEFLERAVAASSCSDPVSSRSTKRCRSLA